ncbi:BREX system Lon protease-like protein BrxL [Vreelandella titanicae]
MSSRRIGLVGMWGLVAFDEVAGISFKDKEGVQTMKDYMVSGSLPLGANRRKPLLRWCLSATSSKASSRW